MKLNNLIEPPVQEVINLSHKTYTNSDQSHFPRLREQVDALHADHFNLTARMQNLDRERDWSCEDVCQAVDFHIAIYMLPAGHFMPIHDHPGMTVLMRVLYGQMFIKAYDWARDYPFEGLVRSTYSGRLHGGHNSVLIEAQRGNLHTIYAEEDCAFLDILAPPYDPAAGSDCHYYREGDWVERDGETFLQLYDGEQG